MFRNVDESGNILFAENALRYNGLDIFITPAGERHRRFIGRVNFDSRMFYVWRDSSLHVLKNYNAYGFNCHVLSTAKKFDRVAVIETDTQRVYCVETQFILKEGQFILNQFQGLKKQIFITREWLSHYEITRVEFKQQILFESKPVA